MAGQTVAQGIQKQTVIIKQAGLGTPGAGNGGQVMRRKTAVFKASRAMFKSDEIVQHQQDTGDNYGLKSTDGKLDGILSPKTYAFLFASLLRKDLVIGVNSTALVNVTAAVTTGAQGTFTRAAGSFLTDGFKIGDVVRQVGWTAGAVNNNAHNMLIIGLTATVMTVVTLDGAPVMAKAAGDSVTITVVGKKTMAPLTGHTNDYFSVEEWYADIAKSELFTDTKVTQCAVTLPGTGNVTVSFDFLGIERKLGTAQVLTTPTAETNTSPLTAVNGILFLNGQPVSNITGSNITINGNMKQGDALVGSNNPADISRGRIMVTGQFTGLFTDQIISSLYDSETVTSIVMAMTADNTPASDVVTFSMGRIKVTGDAPDDGEKMIIRTYPFTAEINIAGGTAIAWDQTILSMQDSAA